MKNEAKPRVYDILAKAFIQEDVRTCFALLGDANMNWAARLSEQGCRMVYVRHEHCALAAAMAYARKNWDVGVATVTCGPGVTQLITALPAAVRAHLPLVVFAGEAPLKSGWYNQEHRPGAAHHCNGCRLSQPAHARAHACCGTRRIPAGAPRTSARGDRYSVRSAGPALGRTGGICPGPRTNCCRALRRFRRIPTTWPAPRNWLPAPNGWSCLPAWVRSKPRRGPLAGRWPPRRVDCCPRRFPREGCSTTILFASASRAASRPRSGSSTWRRPTWSSRSAARSPTTRAAAASSGRRRRCCRSTSTPSRSVKARKWRVITCEPTRAWASRR